MHMEVSLPGLHFLRHFSNDYLYKPKTYTQSSKTIGNMYFEATVRFERQTFHSLE